MKDHLSRLTERTSALGNYNRKYLHIITKNIDQLTEALEREGKFDRVHLWNYSLEIPGEMDTILECATDDAQKLDFLGCYYALQFLNMNLRTVDIVKLELASKPRDWWVGRRLMLEAGRMFRYLTKSYMERLLEIFLEHKSAPEFVMLGVGTRADQDDIDLGIVHRKPEDPEVLNHVIGRLSSEMFKKATRLHFHLSEHVGDKSLTATMDQYEEILYKGAYNFVIVTEMLGAATILGSNELHEQFRQRVTNRFYYDPKNRANRYHEGYLRGILAEIRSLLTRLKAPETINPKDDGLRAIKTLVTALKLVYGVDKVIAWNIIDELKEKNPERLPQYHDLERTLSFFELFRHLYQIMVAQDEDIDLSEPGVEALVARIALIIGFDKKGVVSAKDFMLVNYYEQLERATDAIAVLTGDLKGHLHSVSILRPIFSGEIHKKPGYKGNLAVDFIRASSFSEGITYWDDFLEQLSRESSGFYKEFIESCYRLPKRMQTKIGRVYVSGTRYDPQSVLRFIVIIGERASDEPSRKVFEVISNLFIDELKHLPDVASSLAHLSHSSPTDLNRFLSLITWEALTRFSAVALDRPTLPGLSPDNRQLRALVDVHHQSSHFFKRHFHQILNKYPVFIKNLHNNDRLREITDGFYSDLTSLPSLSERIERLGDYYDLEFVRVSLLAMAGAGCERTDAEFTEFCDNYTLALYEFCLRDVHLSLGYCLLTYDQLGLYATGGHAREQGFDDDYDLIVILDSEDEEKIDYCNKIVAKMNTHILKRGILPHHRFADHFASYTVSFDQLANHISSGGPDVFVDQSQLLGSRLLVGSSKLEQKLQREIITPCVFERTDLYIENMKQEMRSRHSREEEELLDNIKECPGGLRDIEMLQLMYKVRYRIRDPLTRRLLLRLIEFQPAHAEDFAFVESHLNFIKNLRDLYRLKVAAHNVINPEYLAPVAATMGYGDDDQAAEKLYQEFLKRTARASKVIQRLVDDISS